MAGEKIYEMLWDCEFCSSKKLLGKTHRHCPNCGAAQDPARRYFPSDFEKVAVEDHQYFGVDKTCPFCQTPNGAKATFCGNCGGSLDGAKDVLLRSDQVVGTTTDNIQSAKLDFQNQKSEQGPLKSSSPKEELAFANSKYIKAHPKTPKWVLWMLGSIGIGTIAFVCLGVFWTEKTNLKVTSQEWSRTIQINQFKPVSESSWCDSMPSSGYDVSRTSEIRSYNKVADGETCYTVRSDRGDGTYSEKESCSTNYRQEPVYDSKCYYKIDKWAPDRSVNAKGTASDKEPYWPTPTYKSCSGYQPSIGCEELGARSETYVIHFEENEGKTKGEKHDCDFDQKRWESFDRKTIYQTEKSVIFNYITCDSVKAVNGREN